MRFIHMKVAHRLGWVFGAILALVVGSSGLSLHALKDANEEMRFVVQDAGERTRLLNRMSDDISTVARVLRSIALLSGDQARQAHERPKLVEARKNYDAAWAELQKFPTVDAEEARLREAIAAAATQARALNDQVLALGLSGKPQDAIDLLLGQAGPATERWEEALEASMLLQRKFNALHYERAVADYENMRWQLGLAILAVLGVSSLLGWRVIRSITGQLGGEPAEAQRVAAAVARGDFSGQILLRPGDTHSVMAELSAMQQALSQVILNVRHGAEHVAVASQQIAQGNVDLSQRTEEQATALQQTAATVGVFDETVKHAAGGAAQAHQLAHGASEVALKGGQVVSQVVDTMKDINDSSKRIGDIIGVIDGIAFQTNILALNAAVEAARAGEQGRGFAVVATEVRALAQRSAGAAREIKDLISSSVERVEQGSVLVDQAGATMREVVDSISRVNEIIGRLSEASAQQTANMTQVTSAITQMDQATQQNASLVEQTAAASESMRQQSQQLVDLVKVFNLAQSQTHSAVSV